MMKRFNSVLQSKRRGLAFCLAAALILTCQPIPALAATYDDDADDIKYSVSSSKTLTLDDDDFNDACDELTDEDLDYIKFKLPDTDEGILYYDYDEDEDEDDYTTVSASRKYYMDSSPYLKKVTFVPDEDFSGTVTIKYTGYNEEGDSYAGKIKITVKSSSSSSKSTISYTMSYKKDFVLFDEDDFFDICEDLQDEDLDYVKFTLPDSDDGILYYNYDDDDDDNTEVTSSKKYYYDSSPYLSKVAFVPDDDFSGSLTVKYTGYDTEGDSYSGKVSITVGDEDEDDSDIISYQTSDNSEGVNFDEDDFSELCEDVNDEDLDYIKLSIPSSSKGILYYNYSNGQYSSIVTSSKKYYMDSSPYLGDITFVPDDEYSGTCIISFTGWDVDGDSFSGKISITVGSSDSSVKTISYTGSAGVATIMKDSDFNSVCKELTENQLSYITFTLPSSTYGTLYYGYSQGGSYSSKVREATKYYYDGSPYLLNVSFVPAASFSGTATISYTGYDITGLSYTGSVQISTSTSTSTGSSTVDPSTLVSSKYFADVDTSYSWAVPYIDTLYESSIISGTSVGSSKLYSPASKVTRGDFMLILYRALNMKTSSTATGFVDVASGSYYYTAITTAKALGIAQGSDNYFYPDAAITREDAMVFALRAVNIIGTTISAGDTSSLTSFSDYSAISDYSMSAVAALVKAGIITGSDDNMIYPKGNLTRAQVAAIIYRVINQ